jgi:two-component system sensor histidine kinase KdpD
MTNLLENAARHSPSGSEVHLSVAPTDDTVTVRVADRGPGVPVGDRDRIFEAFYRGASIPDSPGTGLGLAIANAIVTAHGGRIWVEDAEGGGATFAFEIPVCAPRPAPDDAGADDDALADARVGVSADREAPA